MGDLGGSSRVICATLFEALAVSICAVVAQAGCGLGDSGRGRPGEAGSSVTPSSNRRFLQGPDSNAVSTGSLESRLFRRRGAAGLASPEASAPFPSTSEGDGVASGWV